MQNRDLQHPSLEHCGGLLGHSSISKFLQRGTVLKLFLSVQNYPEGKEFNFHGKKLRQSNTRE